MRVYYKTKFHNGKVKEYRSCSPIEDTPLYALCYYMLQRHKNKGKVVTDILANDNYFSHPEISKKLIIEHFKFEVLEGKHIDGRKAEYKKLPWFTFEDAIVNY